MFVNENENELHEENIQNNTGDQLKSDLPDWIKNSDQNLTTNKLTDKGTGEITTELKLIKKSHDYSGWKQENPIEDDLPTQPINTRNFIAEQSQDEKIQVNTNGQVTNPEIINKPISIVDDHLYDEVQKSSHSISPMVPDSINNQENPAIIDLVPIERQNTDAIPDWLLQLAKLDQGQGLSELTSPNLDGEEGLENSIGENDSSVEIKGSF